MDVFYIPQKNILGGEKGLLLTTTKYYANLSS